jgi:hypothetical protein
LRSDLDGWVSFAWIVSIHHQPNAWLNLERMVLIDEQYVHFKRNWAAKLSLAERLTIVCNTFTEPMQVITP